MTNINFDNNREKQIPSQKIKGNLQMLILIVSAVSSRFRVIYKSERLQFKRDKSNFILKNQTKFRR